MGGRARYDEICISAGLIPRLERCGAPYVRAPLVGVEAPYWIVAVLRSDLPSDVAEEAVRRFLADEEALRALITLFEVRRPYWIERTASWDPEEVAAAVLFVLEDLP